MRRLGTFVPFVLFACQPAPAGPTLCPDFIGVGECSMTTARWCGPMDEGNPPSTLDCSTQGGACMMAGDFGAWCAVPEGHTCAAPDQTHASYYACGDHNGASPQLACDLDKGCVQSSNATCDPTMAAPYCDLDKLIVDCTPWGQPVQRQCKELGATGCAAGKCVGVPMGGDCSPQVGCADALTCNAMTHKCDFEEAPHPAVAQVVSNGGHVLAHPRVMTISWATDPRGPILDQLAQELTQTSYWATTTSEYGVGPLTVATPVHLTDAIPMTYTDDEFTKLIAQNTSGTSPPWGPPDRSTIYIIAIPPEVTFDDHGEKCCSTFGGYHSETIVNGVSVPYAIACACAGFNGKETTDVTDLTVGASHELIEAATDPYTNTNPAFIGADDDHMIWTMLTMSGEVGDMCELNSDANIIPAGGQLMVQRTWSNKAAAAGQNPCVPSTGTYYGTEPVLPDTASLPDYFGNVTKTKVVKIAKYDTATIDLPIFTSDISGPVNVIVYDGLYYYYGDNKLLDLKLDRSVGNNGDVLKLSITPNGFDTQLKASVFVVEAHWEGGMSMAMGVVAPP
jgi:hypothetical protein